MPRTINLIRLFFFFFLLFAIGCMKHLAGDGVDRASMIRAAQSYIDSISVQGYPVNYRAAQPKTIRWDLASVVTIGDGKGILAPIVFDNALLMKADFVGDQFFHLDYLTQLLFYRDTVGNYKALVMTNFPDSNFFKDPTRPFTGIRFVEDWHGHVVEKLLYTADGRVMRYRPNAARPAVVVVVQTCYVVSGYNYSPELDETETWTEDAGCTTDFSDIGPGSDAGGIGLGSAASGGAGGGGGTTSTKVTSPVNVLPGTSVIKSIKAYFQCFTNVGGNDHTYTVTVCVDQPDPGTRVAWTTSGSGASGSSGGNNPINAGHAFLILTESYGGTTITRNVGFYPAENVSPFVSSSQGALNDDETHPYNISGSFKVDNAQFFNLLNFISQGNNPGYLYNLNTNNCTTFVLNAAAQAGINLPRTIGTWFDGAGNDPGDLGEDLRTTNIPGMALNLAGGSGVSHYNVGQCN